MEKITVKQKNALREAVGSNGSPVTSNGRNIQVREFNGTYTIVAYKFGDEEIIGKITNRTVTKDGPMLAEVLALIEAYWTY